MNANIQNIDLLIYIFDTDKRATENIKRTVASIVDLVRQGVAIDVRIFNVWYDRYSAGSTCSHAIPSSKECCYDSPLLVENHGNRHRPLPVPLGTSLSQRSAFPNYLNEEYEAAIFYHNKIDADCVFIYHKKYKGAWQIISQLLPEPDRIVGDITLIGPLDDSRRGRRRDAFVRNVDTSVNKPLFELMVLDKLR